MQKVIRENRIRIGRGDISITPLQDEEVPEPMPEEPLAGEPGPGPQAQGPADDKNVGLEDLKEVDPDADVKDNVADDTKDVQANDTKETKAAKKTSNRTKKSE